jgi:hypothetical protein
MNDILPKEINKIEHAETSDNTEDDGNPETPIDPDPGVTRMNKQTVDIGPDGKRRRLVRRRIVRGDPKPNADA